MGTIHEFPQWRAQRTVRTESGLDAQVVIFPGVRIERGEAARLPVSRADRSVTSSPDASRQTR